MFLIDTIKYEQDLYKKIVTEIINKINNHNISYLVSSK